MIKTKTIGKLVLGREAIRILAGSDLRAIEAGVQTSTGPISMDDEDACSTSCPTRTK